MAAQSPEQRAELARERGLMLLIGPEFLDPEFGRSGLYHGMEVYAPHAHALWAQEQRQREGTD